MPSDIKRIGVLTGGGDAPGLNAVIRAVVLAAIRRGWEVMGIRHAFDGIIKGDLIPLDRFSVRGITHQGGTILGTVNRGNPFEEREVQPDGSVRVVDRTAHMVEKFHELGLDCLIAIGGDGTLGFALQLARAGVPVVGIPKTIDNDLSSTVITFGFDTAVGVATEALDRLHSTAEAHERVMVVEVMGRTAGWIALNAGVSSTADVILLPEIPFDIESVCDKIRAREAAGRRFSIVVVAEGASPIGGRCVFKEAAEKRPNQRLGGIAEIVANEIEQRTGKETRSLVLGHLQRGGSPSTFDRLIALRFGCAAVRLIAEGHRGVMVALNPPVVQPVPLEDAVGSIKNVPLDCDTIQTARELGICLGDRA